jgi:hypothetical protein
VTPAAVTPAFALEAYAALGDKRSIASLEKDLRDRGFACSRSTLTKWKDEHRWDDYAPKLAADAVVAEQGKALVAMAQDLTTVEGFERCLTGLEGAADDILKRFRTLLPLVTAEITFDQLMQMVKMAAHVTTAVGNIRAKVGEAATAATKGDTNIRDSNIVMADPQVIAALANLK